MIEKYGEKALHSSELLPVEAMSPPGYFGNAWSDSILIDTYLDIKTQNNEQELARSKVVESAKAYGREAIISGDNYGIRRNLNIIKLYTVPRVSITSRVEGWEDYILGSHNMFFVFLLILLVGGGSFCGERGKQTILLLHTSKNGKGNIMAAKYLAGVVSAVGLTLLFQCITLFVVWWSSGLLGAGQSVAVIDKLKLIPWPLTVGQYSLVQLGCQIFAAIILSVIISTISALSKNTVIAYVAGSLTLGLFLFAQNGSIEWLAGPLALAKPVKYLCNYYTVNFFGFPILWIAVQGTLWTALGGLCVFIAQRVYHRTGEIL
jgi:ABC-type transport system involved in multi-copper enzyme maturation permease subunit